jgi:hypothetical protein
VKDEVLVKVTTIPTMYSDAANYKAYGEIHLRGELTDAHKATLRAALSEGVFYVPRQLGLDHHGPGASSSFPDDFDHGWQHLQLDEAVVEDRDPDFRPLFVAANAEQGGTVEDFVARVVAASHAGWDPTLDVG